MSLEDKRLQNQNIANKIFTRKDEDLDLKRQLLLSPELLIKEKGSDESLDKLSLKIKLIGGKEFTLEEYIAEHMVRYEPKFFRAWFYQLAEIYGADKSVMDEYRKPRFVPKFIVQFVYGRFPFQVIAALRNRSKFIMPGIRGNKLFQYLTKEASEKLDVVIEQVFETMMNSKTIQDFKLQYSKEYKLFFQLDMFENM